MNDQRGSVTVHSFPMLQNRRAELLPEPPSVFPCICAPSRWKVAQPYLPQCNARALFSRSSLLRTLIGSYGASPAVLPTVVYEGTLKTPRIRFASSFFAASAIAVLRGSDRRAC